jgi:Fe-S-cluster containining protein
MRGYDFGFDPNACKECGGVCCKGAKGNVWVKEDEIAAIANALHADKSVVKAHYVKSEREGMRIRENYKDGEYICAFLKNGKCEIYEARPEQCKTFPFWEHFKTDHEALRNECLAVVQR